MYDKMAKLYDEYESYVKKYRDLYGERVIVLYMCGSFYEVYSIEDGLVNIKEISELLNIQISRRNKAILDVDRVNTMMAGFPVHAAKKFVSILVQNNYTVVLVDQVSLPPKPKRAVTGVYSLGTTLDVATVETNNLMSIYFDETSCVKTGKNILCIGVGIIDISIGKSKIYEYNGDFSYCLDELYRIVCSNNPKECILSGDISLAYDDLLAHMGLKKECAHNRIGNYDKNIANISYQKKLLEKVWTPNSLLSVFEYLNIERFVFGTIAYVQLLQFSFQHNENILDKLEKPEIPRDNMILGYNALQQLNIDGNTTSLLNILNNAKTAIGKRAFREFILNHIRDRGEILKRYDIISSMAQTFGKIRKSLENVYDIARLYRRMVLKKLHPADMLQIKETFEALLNIPYENRYLDHMKGFLSFLYDHLDMEEIGKYHLDNISASFFKKNIYNEVDEAHDRYTSYLSFFTQLVDILNKTNKDYFRLEKNTDGYYLTITSKRYNEIKKELGKVVVGDWDIDCKDFVSKSISASSTSCKINHPLFTVINNKIVEKLDHLQRLVLVTYDRFLGTCAKEYGFLFEYMITFIGELDYYSTNAYNAHHYRYVRPNIDMDVTKSYVDIKDLRHPIVEQVSRDVEYVSNDITIGKDVDGYLLYGVNGGGKSVFSKSVAIAVTMAQAGMFVPCSEMTYVPYNYIYTRIPSGDDLYCGKSTFAVEICELRNILKYSDEHTLCIGDEVASGTEGISALSIVAAALTQLSQKRVSFVFATHLHDVADMLNLDNISVYHLEVSYDQRTNSIVYERKLKPGKGSSVYGLEVCKSYDLGDEFMRIANEFRNSVIGHNTSIMNTKKSRYNKEHFVDICDICKKNDASEVHHIKEQHTADKDGFIGSVHKNVESNLVNVCEKCHDDIHSGHITVHGYVLTTGGRILSVSYKEKEKDVTQFVKDLRYVSKKTIKEIIVECKERYDMELTTYKVNKILSSLHQKHS